MADYVEKTNKDCSARDSYACDFLGCDGCDSCSLNCRDVRQYQKEQVVQVWDVALSNMPEEVDQLHATDECQFCRGDHPRAADGYAIVDFAHEEPYTEKGAIMGYGKRVKQPFGTLVQIPVSVCKTCRRNMRIRQNLRWIGMICGAAIALIALAILSIWVPLNSTENPFPFLGLLACTGVGYLAGKNLSIWHAKKHKNDTAYNIFDTEVGEKMKERGWFGFKEENGMTKMRFSKKKIRRNFHVIPEGYERPERENDEPIRLRTR